MKPADFYRNTIGTSIFVAIVFTVSLAFTEYLAQAEQQNFKNLGRQKAAIFSAQIRTSLEREINTTLNLTMGLVVYVNAHPSLSQDEFEVVAKKNTP